MSERDKIVTWIRNYVAEETAGLDLVNFDPDDHAWDRLDAMRKTADCIEAGIHMEGQKAKTLFFFDNFGESDNFFFELEGDYAHLDKTYINCTDDEEKIDELNSLVYDDQWKEKVTKLGEPTRDWTYYVRVGFCP